MVSGRLWFRLTESEATPSPVKLLAMSAGGMDKHEAGKQQAIFRRLRHRGDARRVNAELSVNPGDREVLSTAGRTVNFIDRGFRLTPARRDDSGECAVFG